MSKITLLLADNDQDFLIISGEYLENAGYRVIQAHGREQAQRVLETTNVHLAILDLRLTDDADEKDRSGLILAETVARQVPKIILTKFPTYQDVVKALKLDVHQLPPAVDFVDKREGLKTLLQSIEESLNRYAQINWELTIQWNGYLALTQIVNLIEPGLSGALLSERSAEFEDLLRKLFFEHSQITISDIFSHHNDHLILPVFTHNQHGLKMYLLSCGQVEAIAIEDSLYETAVPQRIVTEKINRSRSAQTPHFAATIYTLSGGNLEEIVTLGKFIRRHAVTETLATLDHLYQHELSSWYEWGRYREETITLRQFYLNTLTQDTAYLQELFIDICHKAFAAGLPLRLNIDTQQLVLSQDNRHAHTYPHPMLLLAQKPPDQISRPQWGTVHGNVNGDTVLVSPAGEAWLVDFRHVTRAPLVCDFVSLETSVKFQHLNINDLNERHLLEQRLLTQTSWQEATAEGLSAEAAVALQLITRIRQWAKNLADCDHYTYHQALYFCTMGFLASYQTNKFYTRRDLVLYSHATLAASMLADAIHNGPFLSVQSNFWIDKPNQTVWVEGQAISLTLQEFQILNYLYEHSGQLCERQAIIENALGEVYDEFDLEQSRLNSAMSRLMQKVEPDPKNRKYFSTIRGRGYKLVTDIS
jgi:DNA-binding response OmpR family regulator